MAAPVVAHPTPHIRYNRGASATQPQRPDPSSQRRLVIHRARRGPCIAPSSCKSGTLRGDSTRAGELMRAGRLHVGGLILLVGFCGCTGAREPSSSAPSASPSVSASSASPSPSETLTPEQAGAKDALLNYYRAVDLMLQDPNDETLAAALEWTTPRQAAAVRADQDSYLDAGYAQVGNAVVRDISFGEPTEVDGTRGIQLTFCEDITEVSIQTEDGDLIETHYESALTTAQMVETGDGKWLVWGTDNTDLKSC